MISDDPICCPVKIRLCGVTRVKMRSFPGDSGKTDIRVKNSANEHSSSCPTYSDDRRPGPVGNRKHAIDDCQTVNRTKKSLYNFFLYDL